MNIRKTVVAAIVVAVVLITGVSLMPGSHKIEPISKAARITAQLFALSRQPARDGLWGRVKGAGPYLNQFLAHPISC